MDDWAHWKDNLAGKSVQFNEGNPQAGFYRQPRKESYGARKTFVPVAYWPGENEVNCRIGDQDVTPERGRDIWTHVCRHPVSEEEYRKVAENGEPWSDEHELVPMDGSNRAPDDNSFEALQAAIEELARDAEKRLSDRPVKPVEDQTEADRIANQADRLAELWKKADEARKAEKRPHDEAATAVQKKWLPLLIAAETYKNLKYSLLTPWLKKLQDTARKAAEEAAAQGAPAADTPRPRAGTRGRAMSLKSTKRAEITDYEACLTFFKDSPDIKLTVQDLANKAVRTGLTVPGAKLIEEEQAV